MDHENNIHIQKELSRRHGGTAKNRGEDTEMNKNEIGTIIVNTALYLHKNLGPGLFESVYETILAKLISRKGLHIQRQVSIPIEFEGEQFDEGFRIDLFVEGKVR